MHERLADCISVETRFAQTISAYRQSAAPLIRSESHRLAMSLLAWQLQLSAPASLAFQRSLRNALNIQGVSYFIHKFPNILRNLLFFKRIA